MIRMFLAALTAMVLTVAANAQQPDQERLDLAYEVLELSNAAQMSRDALELTVPTLRTLVQSQYPGASADQVEEAMTLLSGAMLGIVPEVIDASAVIYANRFTADELRAINQFYRTPAGRKLVAEQPAMMQEISQVSERLGFQAVNSVANELTAIFAQ